MLLKKVGRISGRSLSIRLGLLLTLCAGLSASFVMLAMLAIAWWTTDEQTRRGAETDARTVAFTLQAPVAVLDEQGIRDAMSVLRGQSRVQGVWVYDTAGGLLYAWGEGRPPGRGQNSGGLAEGRLVASSTIFAKGHEAGSVSVQLDLGEQLGMLQRQVLAAVAAAVLGLGLALAISQRLARRISVPVQQLADAATAIAHDQVYERRLPPAGRDEVGRAVAAFNRMIDEIQHRGDALVALNVALQREANESRLARHMAESASQAKTRFLANMSHELRSPLNGVIGAAQLLQAQGADPARRSELVDIIRTSGSNLLGLIESVLDLARIESGAMQLAPEDFNVLECVDAAVLSSAAPALAKGLRLSCIVPPGLCAWRHGDGLRLRQLLMNLLGNAIKFTPRGDVTLELAAGPGPDELCLHVRDTGVGIEAEALRRVFEPFQQADVSTTRRFGGSGLGLTICRELAELMGGRVEVSSRPGLGTCFTLQLPLPMAAVRPKEPLALGLRVAWCEPHEPSARALEALLRRLGCTAQRCDDEASLRQFMAQPDAQGRAPWLFVATDADRGRELLASAADWIEPRHVVQMTDDGAAAEAHARDVVGLPRAVARPVLRSAVVSRLAAVRLRQPAVASATTGRSRHAIEVLVVEDDPINQAVVRAMLEHAGYRCTVAGDGGSALQLLAAQPVALVLMDWQMPDMDGLQATRRLRAGEAGPLNRAVPVVALTANAFAEDRGACMAAGMNDFLTKPVLAAKLIACVDRWTQQSFETQQMPAVTSTHPTPPSEAADVTAATVPLFDPQVLNSLPMVLDGSDPDCVSQLLALFTEGAVQQLQAITRACEHEDHPTLVRALHTLKSTSGQVGAGALAAEVAQLEAAVRAGGRPARGEVDRLNTLLADTLAAIRSAQAQARAPALPLPLPSEHRSECA